VLSHIRSRISGQFAVFALLAFVMAATRFGHTGSPWLPPDASWAVFFVGGFYLARAWRWALAALLLEAVAVDCAAIGYTGVSNYCVTVAYWFIVPAYSLLWLGGAWLRRHYRQSPMDLARLLLGFTISVTLCFLITQGSFYWLGGRIEQASLAGWWSNFARWYGHFLAVSGAYVALAALIEIAFQAIDSAIHARAGAIGSPPDRS
jgi:hypothetical protein